MTNKRFTAILAKNLIARELADNPKEPHIPYILERLKEIEAYTGEGNQPSVVASYSAECLPCHVCGVLVDKDELDENLAYSYPEGLPHCPDHYDEDPGDPCPDCFTLNGAHTRTSCTE